MHSQPSSLTRVSSLAFSSRPLLPSPKKSFFSLLRLDLSGTGARERINNIVEGLAAYYRDVSFDRKWKRPREGAFLIFGGWGPEVRNLSVIQPWCTPEGALSSFGQTRESLEGGQEVARVPLANESGGWVDFASPWIFSINNSEAGNQDSPCWGQARSVLNQCLTHRAPILVGIRL